MFSFNSYCINCSAFEYKCGQGGDTFRELSDLVLLRQLYIYIHKIYKLSPKRLNNYMLYEMLYNIIFATIGYLIDLFEINRYMATLYSHPDWPNIHPRKIQEKMRADILKNPKNLSNLLYYGWDFLAKKWRGQEWSFTTDAFGPMLGNALISDVRLQVL